MSVTLRALFATLLLALPMPALGQAILSKAAGKGATVTSLEQLKGRKVWMVNAPHEDCAKLEALGMEVKCSQGESTFGMEHEIVIWCTQFEHSLAGQILSHIGHPEFEQRTHQTYPPGTDDAECGMFYEVTIRYQDGVSHEPGGSPAASSGDGISRLDQLRGRQIWMVNAPPQDCAKMEALGMIVDCEQGRNTMGMEHQIVIWCTEFEHSIAGTILDHLGRSDFRQRTHQTEPAGTDDGECGMLYEITIRYEDGASHDMSATAPPASGGTAGGIFSKDGATAPAAATTGISELSQLRGREVWMVNAPTEDCRKMEALGMIVDCEQGRDTYGMEYEIVIWCPDFDHSIAGKILDHLGRSHFSQRTHSTPGGATKPEECGMLYEITIRYEDPGS